MKQFPDETAILKRYIKFVDRVVNQKFFRVFADVEMFWKTRRKWRFEWVNLGQMF